VKIKTDEIKTQHTNLGPMGNGLLHTDPFDAAELLECWFHFGDRLYMNLSIKKPALRAGPVKAWLQILLLEKVCHRIGVGCGTRHVSHF
jgi:hypothetical protein